MKMNQLGRTGIEVSELCLGTMTWPTHTPVEDAHAQMELSLDHGINFIDTAEMYPVNPVLPETVGQTEETLGLWFDKTGRRDAWVLATKISGPRGPARNGEPISPDNIATCIEASLKRLRTDYIDLYQLHWPNRGTYGFRGNWTYRPDQARQSGAEIVEEMEACLAVLKEQVERGTIRAFGLSNDTAWGTMKWLEIAERTGGPRVASMQNEYSLMYRMADTDLAELMHHEGISLLPYSPLAAGLLTGKYQGDVTPEGSRRAGTADLGGRISPRAFPTVQAYMDLADRHGVDVVQMAVAWSARRPFVGSSIFGATTLDQLKRILGAADLTLSDELLGDIEQLHYAHPMPF
jgi:aryl-alcohol dehydrogenase-like predicted oxidoreductase